jgi:hypothetical protein
VVIVFEEDEVVVAVIGGTVVVEEETERIPRYSWMYRISKEGDNVWIRSIHWNILREELLLVPLFRNQCTNWMVEDEDDDDNIEDVVTAEEGEEDDEEGTFVRDGGEGVDDGKEEEDGENARTEKVRGILLCCTVFFRC